MPKRNIDKENIIIGKMLKEARERHGILQSELCDITGLTKNHISAVERGVSKASIRMLIGYCNKIGITPNDILNYNDIFIIPELKEMLSTMSEEEQQHIVDILKVIRK